MRFFVRFLAELRAPWSSELLDTLFKPAHWSVEMDESADQIFSKTLREFLKDT